jgi:hypothetical protein
MKRSKFVTFVNFLLSLLFSSTFAEEILSQSTSTWFSKDGSHLLYATFNTTRVGQISMHLYGEPDINDPPLYGSTMSLRYPKVWARTFQGLHAVLLWIPTKLFLL